MYARAVDAKIQAGMRALDASLNPMSVKFVYTISKCLSMHEHMSTPLAQQTAIRRGIISQGHVWNAASTEIS